MSNEHDRCRSCGAPVVWAHTENGQRIPVDPQPITGGNLLLVGLTDPPRVVYDKRHGTHRTHFASCPHAKQWRRER